MGLQVAIANLPPLVPIKAPPPAPPGSGTPLRAPPPPNLQGTPGGEVDNLVDLLLNEALEGMPAEIRAKIVKVSQGVYRFGTKEVTLHTVNGQLMVYRIGDTVRHVPFKTLLQEEGLTPAQLAAIGIGPAGAMTPALPAPAADVSSVAKIAELAQANSSGANTTAILPGLPFGHKPVHVPVVEERK